MEVRCPPFCNSTAETHAVGQKQEPTAVECHPPYLPSHCPQQRLTLQKVYWCSPTPPPRCYRPPVRRLAEAGRHVREGRVNRRTFSQGASPGPLGHQLLLLETPALPHAPDGADDVRADGPLDHSEPGHRR
eukprot:164984-Pyramimonas_sp.AAC.1